MSDELDQRLQIYKTPATIRDVKQVFLYVQAFADTTTTSPLQLFTNAGRQYITGTYENPDSPPVLIDPLRVPSYYMPIGTKRKFEIWEQVNSLRDLTIPDDKFMIEISLVEAQIESDPLNWTTQRNLVGIKDTRPADTFGYYTINRTYDVSYELGEIPTDNGGSQNVEKIYFQEARKQTTPQPLFVRIPQLSNGEPYNWTVVNNGQTNDDKSHNVLIRHGQIGFQELELEFGHLTFEGKDNDYGRYGTNVVRDPNADAFNMDADKVKNNINNYQKYRYLDYNWEWYNNDQFLATDATDPNKESEYLVPMGRSHAIVANKTDFYTGAGVAGDVLIRDKPLKFNQQVSNILFRFSIKLIHLF